MPGPVPAGAPRGDAPVRHAGGPVVELAFAADAPFFAGHFPGRPMVPGAKLLERVLAALPSPAARPGRTLRLSRVKFLAPVGPGDTVIVAWHGAGSGWRFECRVGTRVVASGSVAVVDSAGPDARAAGMCA